MKFLLRDYDHFLRYCVSDITRIATARTSTVIIEGFDFSTRFPLSTVSDDTFQQRKKKVNFITSERTFYCEKTENPSICMWLAAISYYIKYTKLDSSVVMLLMFSRLFWAAWWIGFDVLSMKFHFLHQICFSFSFLASNKLRGDYYYFSFALSKKCEESTEGKLRREAQQNRRRRLKGEKENPSALVVNFI